MKREDMAAMFEAVKVLPLRPSDVLVFRAKRPISVAQANLVKEIVQEITGHEKVLVIDNDADVDVIRSVPWWKFW